MHYKRIKKHGSADYRWGGKVVGRECSFCDRPAIAKEMCWRHYQMARNHDDPLHADKKKVDQIEPGRHKRRGYMMVTGATETRTAQPATARTEKTDRHSAKNFEGQGLRGNGRRREWEHRRIAGATKGQIVHHIDGDPLNNERTNLHVFNSPSEHALAHRSLEKVAYALLQDGLVRFDPVSGLYELTNSALSA